MKNKRNYYRILYIQPDAPAAIVRVSFQTLMQKLKQHPDLGGEHWNASIIIEAYRVLIDVDKRRAYDRALFAENDCASLGRQHSRQRDGGAEQNPACSGWRPFRPKVFC